MESSSTKDILGVHNYTYKKWIEFQCTPEFNWKVIEVDHVRPIRSFDIPNNEELLEAFNWKNTEPLLKEIISTRELNPTLKDSKLQFIQAYQFIKLIEEGFNKDLHG